MTDLLAEAAPPPQRPEPKRDRWGRYIIPHPETGKAISWTRATTWASSVSDTWGLTRWQLRMSALGLARRPDLLAQVATVTDPDDPDAKKLLDKLADQAKEHAGASTRANLGTALHSFCERHDLGDPVQVPEPWDRDVAAYAETIRAAGLTIDRVHVERIVTVPELLVAGTFDRLVTTDRRLMVADLKTGRDLSYSWTEIAIQLALYAHASTIYDPVSETHEPMPEVDQTRALVMHLPVGQATCTLYEVDIAAGWEMAQICGTVRDWRKRKNLAIKFSGADAPSVAPRTVSGSSSDGTPASAPESPLEQYETEPARADRREWITGRVRAISEHPDALATLLRAWPEGIEGFKNGHQHTNPEVVAIAKACAEAERAHRLAFPDRDPVEVEATACVRPDDQQIIELTDRLRTLPPDLLAEVEAEAVTARGIPRMSSGRCTHAQLDQIAELVSAACATAAERRGLTNAHLAVLEEKVPRALHGEVLRVITRGRHDEADRLTEWEAERLGEIVDAIGLGLLELGGDGFAAHTDMSRGDLLAAGKAIADELGIDRPKSSADVLGDPVLFAALAAK